MENSAHSLPREGDVSYLPSRGLVSRKAIPSNTGHDTSYSPVSLMSDAERTSDSSPEIRSRKSAVHEHSSPVSDSPPSHRVAKKRWSGPRGWWLFELLACALSISSMAALVGVLAAYDGTSAQPLPHGITLNGLAAVLSTICRSSLMVPVASGLSQGMWLWFSARKTHAGRNLKDVETFDKASRGSLGSLQLLWTLKMGHLACFGALITILALAFDAFIQQILTTATKNALVLASDPRSVHLDVVRSERLTEIYSYAGNTDPEGATLDWPVYAAFYSGVLASNASFNSASCPTGNCTWPPIPTLGVCGGCHPLSFTANTSDPSSLVYTLPDGNIFSIYLDESQYPLFEVFPDIDNGTSFYTNETTTAYIARFEAIGMPYNEMIPDNSMISAQECALWYCIQALDVSVTDFKTEESVIDTWSTIDTFPTYDLTNVSSVTINFTDIPTSLNVQPNASYSVNILAYLTTTAALNEFFDATVTDGKDASGSSGAGGGWADALWANWGQTGDLTNMVSNVAKSMTNNIRQTFPAPTYSKYGGQATQEEIVVRVRWEWLTLPVLLVVCSALFLASSMLQTQNSQLRAWKSSPLALMFTGVEEQLRDLTQGNMDRHGELKEKIGTRKVKLVGADGFLQFQESGSDMHRLP